MRVAVIGGGVVGLCCAAALRRRGAEVCVLEAGRCGDGASLGNAGWVVPFLSAPRAAPGAAAHVARAMATGAPGPIVRPRADREFVRWLWRCWRSCTSARHRGGREALLRLARDAGERFDELEDLGVDFEMHADGLLCAALGDAELDELADEAERLGALGYRAPFERVAGDAVRRLEPALSERVAGGLLLRGERHVDPETLVGGLVAHLREAGAVVREGARVTRLVRRRALPWRIDVAGSDPQFADAALVTAGADSAALVAPLGVALALEGARGTSVTARGTGTAPSRPLKLAEANVACSPLRAGIRLSGGYEIGARAADDGAAEPRRVATILAAASPYLRDFHPSGARREWSGRRPVTPDDLPIVGPVPGLPGLHLATGPGTLGVTLAPGTGAAVAPIILRGDSDPVLEPFRVDRPAIAGRRSRRRHGPGWTPTRRYRRGGVAAR